MNFQKLFNDYGVPSVDNVNRGWINVTCPFCNDRTYNGGFNITGNYFHCWKCGGHSLIPSLSKVLNIPKSEVREIVEEYEGNIIGESTRKIPKAQRLELPTDTFTKVEEKYLLNRGFNPSDLRDKYKIVGGGIVGRWSHRIIIPLILNGRIVSWTARSILSKEEINRLKIPRYQNLSIEESIVDPKSTLYNLDNAIGDTVVLTEGAFDVIRLGDNFVSSFGTELTQNQLFQLKQRFRKVYIMFDNESKAQEKARRYGMQLCSMGLDVEIVDAYSDFNKNDGAELSDEEVKIIRKELNL